MRAPEFWASDGLPARLLAPIGAGYALAGRLRRCLTRARPNPAPVICVGELTVGGSGKTPTALALAERLIAIGHRPHFVSRGYRGREVGPVRVNPAEHDAAAVGDEPLLLAATAPTWVARDRLAGGVAAVRAGATVLILDDGLQNPTFRPDVALLAVDGDYGFGNRRVVPAGPLREPLDDAVARIDAAVRIGDDRVGVERRLPPALPRLGARLVPGPGAPEVGRRRLVAFAGIGRPTKFFATLSAAGARLEATHAFPDHHAYRVAEIEVLLDDAARSGATCMTTAKDWVRLPIELRQKVVYMPVKLAWSNRAHVDRWLADTLASRGITMR